MFFLEIFILDTMSDENIEDILKLINNAVVENYSVQFWVPSIDKDKLIKFKPFNVHQQKKLIKTALSTDIYNSSFCIEYYNILKENYLSPDIIAFDSLSVLDKLFISLELKKNTNKIYSFTSTSTKEAVEINLEDLLTQIKDSISNNIVIIEKNTFTHNTTTVVCNVPSMYAEMICERDRTAVESTDINDQIQNIIIETIINELAKYTTQVNFGDTHIDLNQYDFNNRKKILEQVPAFILEQSMNYILEYKKLIEQLLTVQLQDKTEILQIDGSFFATL